MNYTKKDLLGLRELSKDEILCFIQRAKTYKVLNNSSIKKSDALRGKTVINAFFENSTRTRVSFETAAKRLGADAINFTASSSSVSKGETLIDTIHNMAAMKTDIFVLRHKSSGAAQFVAKNTEASVVNAGDGLNEHPSQGILDIFTLLENKGYLNGLNISIIGDIEHSRVARSDIWGMSKFGANITLFGPPFFMPRRSEVFGCKVAKNINEALDGADAVIMLRVQLERLGGELEFPSSREYSRFFGLSKDKLKLVKDDCVIMHPGPINRGVELNSDVADGKHSLILNQVENGVAVRMAILDILNSNRG
ncbi:MAG: aspartate carbamoyltransferase catalytic subunit [Campylobacter sp.]|nr:aspartate carbamoyltransferase catalytic subunit [Campylobacter sp.]